MVDAKALSPTMFTPWGKVLGPTAHPEQKSNSQATLIRALTSIPAQLLYDTFSMVYYTVIALPSLLIGSGFLMYGAFIEKNEQKQKEHIQFAQEKCFGNVVLAPYFALAIVVDFLRELCALFSRTYSTIMQTAEEKNTPYCTMG